MDKHLISTLCQKNSYVTDLWVVFTQGVSCLMTRKDFTLIFDWTFAHFRAIHPTYTNTSYQSIYCMTGEKQVKKKDL